MSFTQVHFWLILGAALLIIEVFGFTGFLVGIAIAALVTGLITAVVAPTGVWTAALIFGALSVLFTWIYWQYFRGFNTSTDAPSLHKRAENQIGKTFELTEDVGASARHQFLGDTRWEVISASGTTLTSGSRARVSGVSDEGQLELVAESP
ncbi:MAG: NfeD family protein [Pseudomonadales bacterium]